MEAERENKRDRERGHEAEAGQLQQPAAKLLELDLEPGKQEQEGEAEQAHQLYRLVDRRPAEHRGAEHDSEHDLEHDRREAQRGHEAEPERSCKRRRGDDQQVGEVDLH